MNFKFDLAKVLFSIKAYTYVACVNQLKEYLNEVYLQYLW